MISGRCFSLAIIDVAINCLDGSQLPNIIRCKKVKLVSRITGIGSFTLRNGVCSDGRRTFSRGWSSLKVDPPTNMASCTFRKWCVSIIDWGQDSNKLDVTDILSMLLAAIIPSSVWAYANVTNGRVVVIGIVMEPSFWWLRLSFFRLSFIHKSRRDRMCWYGSLSPSTTWLVWRIWFVTVAVASSCACIFELEYARWLHISNR